MINRMLARRALLSLLLGWVTAASSASSGASAEKGPIEGIKVPLVGHFTVDEDAALNLSGIDCSTPTDKPTRVCLVALDEGLAAQLVELTLEPAASLTVRQTVPLLRKSDASDPKLAGLPGKVKCSAGTKKFNENDSEGVSFLDGYFYVAGSHGCGRHSDAFKASAYIDLRIGAPAAADVPVGDVKWTPQLNEVLSALPDLNFGQNINGGSGLTVEGIAGSHGTLFFGLRSPVLTDGAPIVAVPASDLFDGTGPTPHAVHTVALEGLGIRDLAVLPGSQAPADSDPIRLLILAGPKSGDGGPFKVFLLELPDDQKMTDQKSAPRRLLGELKTEPGEKAEGMVVTNHTDTAVGVLILYDDVTDGDPTLYQLDLSSQN